MTHRHLAVKQAATGQWRAVLSTPHPALRRFIVGPYVGWSESTVETVHRRELPTLFVPVILSFRAPFTIAGAMHSSFLAGMQRGYTAVASAGQVECLQVNLTLDAACRMLRRPFGELAESISAIDDVLGVRGQDIIEQLGNTEDWVQRFDVLDSFLLDRIPNRSGLSPEVAWSLNLLTKAHGAVAIGDLVHDTGLSYKKLIRQFRNEVGLLPKLVARIQRLHCAVAAFARNAPNLAQIALEAGYSDQAHFNRDFRAFSGMTPLEYLNGRDPELAHLQADR